VPLCLFPGMHHSLVSFSFVLFLFICLSPFFAPQSLRRHWWVASALPLPPPLVTSETCGVLGTSCGCHSSRRVRPDDLLHADAAAPLASVAAAVKSTPNGYWGWRDIDGRGTSGGGGALGSRCRSIRNRREPGTSAGSMVRVRKK